MKKFELVQAWQTEIPAEQTARLGYRFSGINGLELTPDDRFAVTLNYQFRELIIWDFATGQRLFSHDWGGYNKVRDLYLTPDGAYAVVTGETGGVVPIIPTEAPPLPKNSYYALAPLIPGERPRPLPQEDYVLVNARSQRAITSNGTYGRVWDLEKSQIVLALELPAFERDPGNPWNPFDVRAISADGRLGAGMFDCHALVWDLGNGKLLWQHDFGKRYSQIMLFTPDGQQIILNDGAILETWRWSTDKRDGPIFNTRGSMVHSPKFTPDGRTLITGSEDGVIEVWDWPDCKLRKTLCGHQHKINYLAVSSDGEYLASGGEDTSLRKWHLPSGQQIFSTLTPGYGAKYLSIDPHRHYVISSYGSDQATPAIYDLASGALQRVLQGHQGNVNAVDYLADGRLLLTASDDHTLRIWNLESGETIQTLSRMHTSAVQAAVALSSHAQVISAAADGRIILWDITTGQPIRQILSYTPPESWTKQYVYLDQRGRRAIVNKADSSRDGATSVLLDLESKREVLEFSGRMTGWCHAGGILSPGGRWLMEIEPPWQWDHLKITNLETQQSIRNKIAGRLGDLWSFSANEQFLACSSEQTRIVLVDLASGAFQLVPQRHTKELTALALSPDGKLGASAAFDKSVRVWEVSSGQELAALNLDQHITTLVFDPHNNYLLAGGGNMNIYCLELRELSGK